MPEGVNTRKCIRACARGIVYTLKKDPRALALHLLHPLLRAVPVEATRLSPRRASGLRLQGPRQRGRTPAWTRHGLPVKSSSTVRESVLLRPSPRVLQSPKNDPKNGPSNKRVTKCTKNPVLRCGRRVKMAPFISAHGVPEYGTSAPVGGVNLFQAYRPRPRPQSRSRQIRFLKIWSKTLEDMGPQSLVVHIPGSGRWRHRRRRWWCTWHASRGEGGPKSLTGISPRPHPRSYSRNM